MYKAIIFDLDGTLLDTSRDICFTLNGSLRKFSLEELDLETTVSYVGDGARKLVERAVGGAAERTDKVYADFALAYEQCANKFTSLYDGEDAALRRFKRAGIKLAVITNKPQKTAERVCAQFLSPYGFSYIIGNGGEYPLKPDPASTLAVINALGLNKEDCLFVGDGEADILTAKNAGVRCVSALWGFRSIKQLSAAGSEGFALDFKMLEKTVFGL